MVRLIASWMVLIGSCFMCRAEPLTNVTALIGRPLGTNDLALIPSRDGSSPDTVFLGTLKAMYGGELRDFLYHFDLNYLQDWTNGFSHVNFSEESAASFRQAMCKPAFSNVIVKLWSTSCSNQCMRLSAMIQENCADSTLSYSFPLTLRRELTAWKIVSFEDDRSDE